MVRNSPKVVQLAIGEARTGTWGVFGPQASAFTHSATLPFLTQTDKPAIALEGPTTTCQVPG